MKDIQSILFTFIRFLSWAWVIPASIAGKLMTNELVYGEVLNFSYFLWKVRNVMRSMANYALGLYFLYKVISVVMTMQAISTLKDILLKTV